MQRRFTDVWRPDKSDLGGPLGTNNRRRACARTAFFRSGKILRELFDARLDIRLQVVGAFVLGNRTQHLAQAVETLFGIARAPECGLCGFVFGCQVGRHGIGVQSVVALALVASAYDRRYFCADRRATVWLHGWLPSLGIPLPVSECRFRGGRS